MFTSVLLAMERKLIVMLCLHLILLSRLISNVNVIGSEVKVLTRQNLIVR